jgi:zinc protease
VVERTLENGMRALVWPRRGVPIVCSSLFYPVGSFDDPPGRSGMAHFVEHMLFKGTQRFPKGQIDRLVSVFGGQCNAETGEDSTHYWFAFPSDRWELALEIEADRMCGIRFDSREVELEGRVIAEERARELHTPPGQLDQNHLAITYLRHPYRNPILGWDDDVARIGSDDLASFYGIHYRPDGAVMVVVGDIEPERALDQIADAFAGVRPGTRARPRFHRVEPPQSGRRGFTLFDCETIARGLFGWRTVPRGDGDLPALEVLAELLTGGRRSRLWQALVESRAAGPGSDAILCVEAAHAAAHRAGQFFIQVEADGDARPAEIERRIGDVLSELANSGPTRDELARARRRLDAGWRWEQEDLASLATALGTAAVWGDWRTWLVEHRAAIAVGPDAIRRVAAKYLTDSGLTVGWSLPRNGAAAAPFPAPSPRAVKLESALRRAAARSPGGGAAIEGQDRSVTEQSSALERLMVPIAVVPSREVDYKPRRTILGNGLRLVYEQRRGTGVVAIELYCDAGSVREARPGLAAFTGRLLEEGTTRRGALAVAAAIEDVGGSLEVGATGASVRVPAEALAVAVELLAEVTLRPAFSADAIERVAWRMAAELRGDLDDPVYRADLCFRALVYGTHPLGRDPRGTPGQISRLTVPDVRAHHARFFVPESTILVATGDFESQRLEQLVTAGFGGWPARARPLAPVRPVPAPRQPRVRRTHFDGDQVHIVMGHLGVSRQHPDYDALVVLDHVFGSGPGCCDRLGRIVRDELGLVYAIGGGMTDSADLLPGLFRVNAATTAEAVDRVVATISEQIRAMQCGAFSDDEVDRARRYLAGAWVFDFQTVDQRAERLLEVERLGLSLDEPMRWPGRVATVTSKQVRNAAAAHFRSEALCRVELGPLVRRRRPTS